MPIINTFPTTIANGDPEDANVLMSLLNWIQSQVNTNGYAAGAALGTPASGTVTNLTGTASININGTVGATTPTTGAFTALTASSITIEALHAPSLLNSWVNTGGALLGAGYWKDTFGVVHLQGSVSSGAVGATAFVLPANYRPLGTVYFITPSTAQYGGVSVDSVGNVNIVAGSNAFVSLDGITFRTT